MIVGARGGYCRAGKIRFVEADQGDLPCPVPLLKIFLFFRSANQFMWFSIPSRKRGVCHRHERGAGSGGRGGAGAQG